MIWASNQSLVALFLRFETRHAYLQHLSIFRVLSIPPPIFSSPLKLESTVVVADLNIAFFLL